jgi:drug/metabolite transporter (DMT)-like permease
MGDIEMFATNVGGIDRILRIVVGLALIAWFFMDQGTGFWHWAKLIGIVPLATGLMSSCPLYSILGLSTCPVKRA